MIDIEKINSMEEMLLEEMGAIIFKAFISGETVRDIATALYNAGYRKSDTIREFAEKLEKRLKERPQEELAELIDDISKVNF